MKATIQINGIDIGRYLSNGHDIIIPGGLDLLKNIQPIKGKILSACYCPSNIGDKKWKVYLNADKQKLIGKNVWSKVFYNREEAEKFINDFENL